MTALQKSDAQTGHTAAPWAITDTIRREGVCKVSAGGMGLVAIVGNGFNIGTYANDARLIAAAPCLLEALRACRLELDYCQKQLAAHGQTGSPNDSVSRALAAGAAAITKATGQ